MYDPHLLPASTNFLQHSRQDEAIDHQLLDPRLFQDVAVETSTQELQGQETLLESWGIDTVNGTITMEATTYNGDVDPSFQSEPAKEDDGFNAELYAQMFSGTYFECLTAEQMRELDRVLGTQLDGASPLPQEYDPGQNSQEHLYDPSPPDYLEFGSYGSQEQYYVADSQQKPLENGQQEQVIQELSSEQPYHKPSPPHEQVQSNSHGEYHGPPVEGEYQEYHDSQCEQGLYTLQHASHLPGNQTEHPEYNPFGEHQFFPDYDMEKQYYEPTATLQPQQDQGEYNLENLQMDASNPVENLPCEQQQDQQCLPPSPEYLHDVDNQLQPQPQAGASVPDGIDELLCSVGLAESTSALAELTSTLAESTAGPPIQAPVAAPLPASLPAPLPTPLPVIARPTPRKPAPPNDNHLLNVVDGIVGPCVSLPSLMAFPPPGTIVEPGVSWAAAQRLLNIPEDLAELDTLGTYAKATFASDPVKWQFPLKGKNAKLQLKGWLEAVAWPDAAISTVRAFIAESDEPVGWGFWVLFLKWRWDCRTPQDSERTKEGWRAKRSAKEQASAEAAAAEPASEPVKKKKQRRSKKGIALELEQADLAKSHDIVQVPK
ncbi:hypothetical protein EDC01DRAFT_631105 [Geopyxis carbonaria]|nr:hypothetical protein EDC01DRAFT_631105 [Geopyxis carbonaria]